MMNKYNSKKLHLRYLIDNEVEKLVAIKKVKIY